MAVSDITQCILLISGTMAFLPALLSTRGKLRVFWTFMMMGIGLWLAYQLLWTYFEVVLRKDVPNPFGGDVVLFLHFVPMMAAVALEVNLNSNERTLTFGSLDFSLLFTWWLYLYLFLVIPWQYIDTREIFYSDNLNLLYLTEKSVFLAAVASRLALEHRQMEDILCTSYRRRPYLFFKLISRELGARSRRLFFRKPL